MQRLLVTINFLPQVNYTPDFGKDALALADTWLAFTIILGIIFGIIFIVLCVVKLIYYWLLKF